MDRHDHKKEKGTLLSIIGRLSSDTIVPASVFLDARDDIGNEVSSEALGILGLFPLAVQQELLEVKLSTRQRSQLTTAIAEVAAGIKYAGESLDIDRLMRAAYKKIVGHAKIPPISLRKTLTYLGLFPKGDHPTWQKQKGRELNPQALFKKTEFVIQTLDKRP